MFSVANLLFFLESCKCIHYTAMDISYLPRAYLPSNWGLTGSLYWASWSFSQHQILAASQLGPLLQLLFPWVAEISVVLKQLSKNQNEFFFTKELFSKKFSFWFFDCYYKTTESLANHGNKSWRRGPNWLAAKSCSWENDQEIDERLSVRSCLVLFEALVKRLLSRAVHAN